MPKYLLLFFTTLISLQLAKAQEFEFGKYDKGDLEMKRYAKDTGAHAVVLNEYGMAGISSGDGMPLVYQYHVKIKIFDSKGFDQGNVFISLYQGDNDKFETVRDIKGQTYYTDENGLVQKAELDDKKIFHEHVNKHHDAVKFALPNLRNGCVIEYSYVVESPYRYNFHDWQFQAEIPKIHSQYETHIPAIYDYNILLRGYLKLKSSDAVIERDCFSYYGVKADCTKATYVMDDIPAFIEEAYMTSPKNYISAIYFELAAATNENGTKVKITKEWKDVDYEMKSNEDFGSQMKRRDFLRERLPVAMMAIPDTLERAKAIYYYMQNWFKWNGAYRVFTDDGIKKAFESHTGTSADINLSLVAALSTAGIETEAVVLSTRENGSVNKLFPVISDFNYVVAKIDVGGHTYMLDATDKLIPFGLLPLRCVNEQGRVMSRTKPSYWIDMEQEQRKSSVSNLNLTMQPDGKITGTITTYSLGYEAYEKRKAIKKFNTTAEYVENLDEKLNRLKILKFEITGVDSVEQTLTEKYDVEISPANKLNLESIAFDPSFWSRETENPFKLEERNFPVDMGFKSQTRVTVTLTYPEKYAVTAQPAPVGFGLPNKGGNYITNIVVEPGIINYSQILQLNKSVYVPSEYPYLKELYNKIIQNQKANLIFTKKL